MGEGGSEETSPEIRVRGRARVDPERLDTRRRLGCGTGTNSAGSRARHSGRVGVVGAKAKQRLFADERKQARAMGRRKVQQRGRCSAARRSARRLERRVLEQETATMAAKWRVDLEELQEMEQRVVELHEEVEEERALARVARKELRKEICVLEGHARRLQEEGGVLDAELRQMEEQLAAVAQSTMGEAAGKETAGASAMEQAAAMAMESGGPSPPPSPPPASPPATRAPRTGKRVGKQRAAAAKDPPPETDGGDSPGRAAKQVQAGPSAGSRPMAVYSGGKGGLEDTGGRRQG